MLAEDAVQDAFLSVWRDARRFRSDRSNAHAWILMLVHRRAVDLVRREQRRRASSLEEAPADERAADGGSDARVLERDEVRRALGTLPEPQREVLELAYYDGLTQPEVAARLGMPLGTVKSRTMAALTALRQTLMAAGVVG